MPLSFEELQKLNIDDIVYECDQIVGTIKIKVKTKPELDSNNQLRFVATCVEDGIDIYYLFTENHMYYCPRIYTYPAYGTNIV